MFIDQARIHVRSGRGGDGCVSFRREKYVAKGGPDGGDGGDGGSVVLIADPNVETLMDFAGRHHWHAENGKPGMSKDMFGRAGADLAIHVPPGTMIYDEETSELVVDMDEPGKQYPIAEGGKGGLGNLNFKSATNQVPYESTPGGPSVEFMLRLELKVIADVGLIGKPNAGKSTLLSTISEATPRIADYPFTTLQPQLGIAELSGQRRIVFADIPGLIENAHQGAGLGTRFLRHVERTRLLVHVLELEPTDGSDPVENYYTIRKELEAYSPTLAEKPEIIALSKTDLLGEQEDIDVAVELLQQAFGHKRLEYPSPPMVTFSSANRVGLEGLLDLSWKHLGEVKQPEAGWGDRKKVVADHGDVEGGGGVDTDGDQDVSVGRDGD